MVTEAHSTIGRARALGRATGPDWLPTGYSSYWSHLPRSPQGAEAPPPGGEGRDGGGVGIVISDSFVTAVTGVQGKVSWREVIKGRVALLRLTGP